MYILTYKKRLILRRYGGSHLFICQDTQGSNPYLRGHRL